MTDLLTDPDAVLAALTDDNYRMPPVDPAAGAGIAWLRAAVARFCDGVPHARRRALATDLLDGIDPDKLRERARDRTHTILAEGRGPVDVMAAIARPVPVGVLAAALGVESDLTPAVAAVARSYQPHATADAAADAAVAALVTAFGGSAGPADESTAARIGLLAQACDATAGLIGNAILAGSIDSLDPSRTTVVVCRSGNRSELASLMLQARGFTTHNLERGLEEWHAEGLPLVTDDGSAGRVA